MAVHNFFLHYRALELSSCRMMVVVAATALLDHFPLLLEIIKLQVTLSRTLLEMYHCAGKNL